MLRNKTFAPEFCSLISKSRYTRGSLLLKHAPETPSWVSTPTSTHEGHDEGACPRSTLLQHAPGAKLPRLHQRFLAKTYVAQQNFCSRDLHGKQISVHTRELAPKTDSCNRFAPGACSLISNQFDTREQNSGAKVLLRNISLEIVGADEGALLQERVAGACCGSKLPRVYRPKLVWYEGASSRGKSVARVCFRSKLPRVYWNLLALKWRAKLGSKSFVAQHTFSLEIVGALLRERAAGAPCGSKLPRHVLRVYWLGYLPGSVFQEQSPSCVLAFTHLN